MTSKNPPDRRFGFRGRSTPRSRRGKEPEKPKAVILDFVQSQIEAYNREQGGGVVVRKDRSGYTLLREDTGAPVARLRPRRDQGLFEVLCWSGSRLGWRAVDALRGSDLSLDDALEFISRDPTDCFWY